MALAATAMMFAGCKGGEVEQTQPVGILPTGVLTETLQVSANGQDWICLVKKDEGLAVRSSQLGSAHPCDQKTRLMISCAGFPAFWSGGERCLLWVGRDGRGLNALRPGRLWWSPDGKRWIAAFMEPPPDIPVGPTVGLLVDWNPSRISGLEGFSPPAWSLDSKHVAFLGGRGRLALYVDDVPVKRYAEDRMLTVDPETALLQVGAVFTADGEVATIAPAEQGPGWEVVKSGQVLARYAGGAINLGGLVMISEPSAVVGSSLTVSKDGRTIAWWARPDNMTKDAWTCMVDGRSAGRSVGVNPWHDTIMLSDSGQHVAYVETEFSGNDPRDRKATGMRVVVDGKQEPLYKQLDGFVFSPNGSAHAYWATKDEGGQSVLVLNGREVSQEAGPVGTLVFSPDSKHYAYDAARGTRRKVVVDGTAWGRDYDAVFVLSFDRDGALGFVARDAQQLLAIRLPPTRKSGDASPIS
jgi:hypothetical protein